FKAGTNTVRAVGHTAGRDLTDEIAFEYQTAEWSKPARLALKQIADTNGLVTVEARAFDKAGVPCLDAANVVRFGLVGDGRLLDNLGTVGGSRVVQLANGRAQIAIQLTGRKAVVSVASEGFTTQFLNVTNSPKPIVISEKANGRSASGLEVSPELTLDVAAIDRDRILKAADVALKQEPVSITKFHAEHSSGGPHDFFSNADYFWPDPTKSNGLPFISRDGMSYPGVFTAHRMAMRDLRDAVAALGAAYKINQDERYARKAAELLRVFFLDPATRMNPNLEYAQAVLGRSPGRSYGIIDALHLIEIPPAITAMQQSAPFSPELIAGLKRWFADLSDWMVTSKNGREEATAKNNHAVAFWLQIACFARFTGDEAKLAECRRQFKEVFVPNQMADDGSFPQELNRTKPYGYSIFQLDNMATLCQVLTTPEDNLWEFQLPDGRGMRQAVAYLYPFLADKSKWPLKPDVQAWESWPARQPCLLFAGLAYGQPGYLELWKRLPADPKDFEVRRNMGITQPVLWIGNQESARLAATKR
ncbi:MAG: alginate lyase family protein, partial [Verrucomicrobiota bacterium]